MKHIQTLFLSKVCSFMIFFVVIFSTGIVGGMVGKVYAEQITTVAIIDMAKVFSAFPSESRGYENLETLKTRYQKEIDDQINTLNTLKKKKNLALKAEDYDEATALDRRITQQSNYITSLSERRQQDLIKRSNQKTSKSFSEKLQNAISYVSEEEGYTLVLQSTGAGIQWWAPIIDITDKVIARLKKK